MLANDPDLTVKPVSTDTTSQGTTPQDTVSQDATSQESRQGVALMTAHKIKMAGGSGTGESMPVNGGGISSYTEGGTSVSFNTSQQTNIVADAEYGLSNYGTQFLSLRRSCIIPILSSAMAG